MYQAEKAAEEDHVAWTVVLKEWIGKCGVRDKIRTDSCFCDIYSISDDYDHDRLNVSVYCF